ncbi:MATE family efflux transporter [Psychrosphaera sp. B3R10]|uniref:MATE family efflux transporter n=1 Tax=unclassified Psychrosphaera TaxID=2641570 RepID=UPI001C08942B|nr:MULTISPECIES: MATE family efflux transporter [unclassified Psychrosphaera]MBU2881862.1 MATE family efflux transporter [Psychrosphaera sp. I2R16]MBU2989883.1 MATE family efflux transporter [Psychrosphaera sp. B3R10]
MNSFWSVTAPSVVTTLCSSITGIILINFVQVISNEAVTVVAVGQRINLTHLSFVMGIGAACTALVGLSWGRGERGSAVNALRSSLLVGGAISLLIVCIVIGFNREIIGFFNLSPNIVADGYHYIIGLTLIFPAQLVIYILDSANRAVGDAYTPLKVNLAANLMTIVFAYLLCFGRLGFSELGLFGIVAGWGLAVWLMAVVYSYWWLSDKLRLPVKATGVANKTNWNDFWHISMPASIEPLILQVSMVFYTGFIAQYGVNELTAFGIGINIFIIFSAIGTGFSMSGSALVMAALGAGCKETVINKAYLTIRSAIFMVTISSVGLAWFSNEIANLLVLDENIVGTTAAFLVVLAIVQPFVVLDQILSGILRTAGDGHFTIKAILISNFGVRIPLGYFVVFSHWPVEYLFYVLIIDVVVKFSFIFPRFYTYGWICRHIK